MDRTGSDGEIIVRCGFGIRNVFRSDSIFSPLKQQLSYNSSGLSPQGMVEIVSSRHRDLLRSSFAASEMPSLPCAETDQDLGSARAKTLEGFDVM